MSEMERVSSQKEKGIGLDYLSEFHLASRNFMSSHSPMDQVFQTFGHHVPVSQVQSSQPPTYGHAAGPQYSVAHSYSMSMPDRYHPMVYSQPYLNEECYGSHITQPGTLLTQPVAHQKNQNYAGALPSSTPPGPPAMHSPQLSPMMRAQRQSPQQSSASVMLQSLVSSAPRAAQAVNSSQATAYTAQLHGPQQHYNSTVMNPTYYPASQCSQRNDPPVGNMHMANINSHSFHQLGQFSSQSSMSSSSQALRNAHSSVSRPTKEEVKSSHLKNKQPGLPRLGPKESNPSSYVPPMSHSLQPRSSAASGSNMQGMFHPNLSLPPTMRASTANGTSSAYRKPNPSAVHPHAVSSSQKTSYETDTLRGVYPGVTQAGNKSKQAAYASNINSSSSAGVGHRSSGMPASSTNPYSVFSIFSLNGQPTREGGRTMGETVVSRGTSVAARGRGTSTAAREKARVRPPDAAHLALNEDANPINWYKSPDSILASSYSSDIEAMQADIILNSNRPIKAVRPQASNGTGSATSSGQRQSTAVASGAVLQAPSQSRSSSEHSACLQQSSISASKAAALAAIKIKQEQAENLCKNKSFHSGIEDSESLASLRTLAKPAAANTSSTNFLISPPSTVTQHSQSLASSSYNKPCNDNLSAIKNSIAKPNSQSVDSPSSNLHAKSDTYSTILDLLNHEEKRITIGINDRKGNSLEHFLEHPNTYITPAPKAFPASRAYEEPKTAENVTDKKNLTARKKVFDMWKAGQVVGRAPGKARGQSREAPVALGDHMAAIKADLKSSSYIQPLLESENRVTAKNREMEPTNVPSGCATVRPELKATQAVKTREHVLDLCFVKLHGHKLICLKSQSEFTVLLCQFQSECFADKGMGSVNNCIDRALRIKKKVLEHPKRDMILHFLQKNGYTVSTVQTINLDDARRVYHYMYKLTSCSGSCVTQLSHQTVDLCSLVMPKKSSMSRETALKIKKEKHTAEDTSYGIHQHNSHLPAKKANAVLNTPEELGKNDKLKTLTPNLDAAHADMNKETDDDLIFVEAIEDPNIITCAPEHPKVGGVCNTIVGQVRFYQHEKENFLVVEDLCNIFSASDFYDSVEKENIVLYSCSEDIATFLNSITGTFARLRTAKESLIKEKDVGAHITDDSSYTGFSGENSTSLKRPICKQEKLDDYEISPKKLKMDEISDNETNEDDLSLFEVGQQEKLVGEKETLAAQTETRKELDATLCIDSLTNLNSSESISNSLGAQEGVTSVVNDGAGSTIAPIENEVLLPLSDVTNNHGPINTSETIETNDSKSSIGIVSKDQLSTTTESPLCNHEASPMKSSCSKCTHLKLQGFKLRNMLMKTKLSVTQSNIEKADSALVSPDTSKKADSALVSPDTIKKADSALVSPDTSKKSDSALVSPDTSKDIQSSLEKSSVDGASNEGSAAAEQENNLEAAMEDCHVGTGQLTTEFQPVVATSVDVSREAVVHTSEPTQSQDSPKLETTPESAESITVTISIEGKSDCVDQVSEISSEGSSSEAADVSSSSENVSAQPSSSSTCDSSLSIKKPHSMSSSSSLMSSNNFQTSKYSFDDLSIIADNTADSLVAHPSNKFNSIKFLLEGYEKLRFQNTSLIQIVHLLRKELAACKEKSEKELVACKEKSEKELTACKEKFEKELAVKQEMLQKSMRERDNLQSTIEAITASFKNGNEETPITIDDD
uniref:Uncharacterized protein n=1 Tax=Biomphalaria glabrata TaxID=6526 RepID=A0A2C9KKM7_BIOGL